MRRLLVAIHEEWRTGTLGWWYVSFSGDTGWKGAVILKAYGHADAIKTAWDLGVNPGGSVLAVPAPPGFVPTNEAINRLLTKEEVEQYVGPVKMIKT